MPETIDRPLDNFTYWSLRAIMQNLIKDLQKEDKICEGDGTQKGRDQAVLRSVLAISAAHKQINEIDAAD